MSLRANHPSVDDLQRVPLLVTLTVRQLERLAGHLDVREVGSGEMLVRQDEKARRFAVLAKGTAKVTVGDDVVVGWLYRHDFFGEMGLLASGRRGATVTALEPCTVWEMDRRAFEQLEREHPEIASVIHEAAEDRRALDARLLTR